MKGRLGHRNGLALAETEVGVRVLVKGDDAVDMPPVQFDACRPVAVGGPSVIGAAGRIWNAAQLGAAGTLRAKWAPEAARVAAMTQAMASLGARRSAAIDAIELGLADVPGQLGLSGSELLWYRSRSAAVGRNAAATLGFLEQLPAQAYAGRVPLLMTLATALIGDPELAKRAAVLLEPFAQESLDARALHAALCPVPGADVLNLLIPFAISAHGAEGPVAGVASAIVKLDQFDLAPTTGLPTVRALGTYLRARVGSFDDKDADVLGIVPVPLIDELIDRRTIMPAQATKVRWRPDTAAYIRCRLDPGRASDADVAEAGFTAEAARRLFLAGQDGAALGGLAADDPAVSHYQALARWRDSGELADQQGLRPAARRVLTMVDSLKTTVTAGGQDVVPEEIAADPSCWPFISDRAMSGGLELPATLRATYPRFGEWLDLCALQRLVFELRWPEVIASGQALDQRTDNEVTSLEALNEVAFAEYQLGNTVAALRTLDQALRRRYAPGLLVNAAVVAASGSSVAAIPYLTRIFSEEPDQGIARGAVQRAIDLWLEDASSPEYPDSLRALVRQALSKAQPDDLHRLLVRQADRFDPTWLATGKDVVAVSSQAQVDALAYYRSWARSRSPDFPDAGLTEVAQVLAKLASVADPPTWVQAENRRFIEELIEAIHCPFGEAVGLAAPIEALLNAGVVEQVTGLVLAAQAGAHVAVYLSDNDGCISPDAERRLIFDTIKKFEASKAGLSEADIEFAGEEVSRCTAAAANAMGLVAQREFARRGEEWDALVRRERYETQNLAPILRQERALLKDLDSWIGRVRMYLTVLRDLPLNEAQRDAQATLSRAAADWSAEVARLQRLM